MAVVGEGVVQLCVEQHVDEAQVYATPVHIAVGAGLLAYAQQADEVVVCVVYRVFEDDGYAPLERHDDEGHGPGVVRVCIERIDSSEHRLYVSRLPFGIVCCGKDVGTVVGGERIEDGLCIVGGVGDNAPMEVFHGRG